MKLWGLCLVLGLVVICFIPTASSSTPTTKAVVYVIPCESCPQGFTIDFFTPYLADLRTAFDKIDITDIEVKNITGNNTDELDLLYQKLGVPSSLRGILVVVDIDDRFLFVNYVPVEFITEFMATYSERYQKFVIYRDVVRELYVVMDDSGHIKECNVQSSISECIGNQALSSSTAESVLPLVVVGGLVDSINPCAFSILLFFVAYLFTMSGVSLEKSRHRILVSGSIYISGVYLAYLAIGLGLMTVVSVAPFPHFIGKVAALLVVLLGIINFKDYLSHSGGSKLGMAESSFDTIKKWMSKLTVPSAFVAGLLVSAFEFPCTGGIYFAITGLLAQKTVFLQGVLYLLIYNMVFVLPLVALCFFASRKFYYKEILEFSSIKCPQPLKKYLGLLSAMSMMALGLALLLFGLV